MNLWNEIEQIIVTKDSSLKEAMEYLRGFISVLEELDPDGVHSRYSKSPKGELYLSKPKFIRVKSLNEVLQNVLLPLINLKLL